MDCCFPTMHVFDRWGARKGVAVPCSEVVHTGDLEGVDALAFETMDPVMKGDRLLWCDGGEWREHEVSSVSASTEGAVAVKAEGSVCELSGDYIEQQYLSKAGAAQAFSSALAGTRWVPEVEDGVDATVTCWLYHADVLSAVRKLAQMMGLELQPVIEVSELGVDRRVLHVTERIGGWRGARFDYGRNLLACRRTVLSDKVKTALYGYGAGLPVYDDEGTWHGGYSRKLTLSSVNSGVNWVGNEGSREIWGRPSVDGSGKEHVFGEAVFPDCEDPEELLRLTLDELARVSVPKVSYEVDAACLDGNCPGLGDDVLVTDPILPGGRALERCIRRERRFEMGMRCALVLGEKAPDMHSEVEGLAMRLDAMEDAIRDMSSEVAVIGSEVFSAAVEPEPEPEPVPGDFRARALLLDDGTLELTYLGDESSPNGGVVAVAFDVVEGCAKVADVPWHGSMKDISALVMDSSFTGAGIKDVSYWFYAATNLASVSGMRYLGGLTGLRYTFTSCTALAELDLRGFALGGNADLYFTFGACNSLERILADADWVLPALSSGYQTFYNCTSLVGGNGTAYSSSRSAGSYLVVDQEGSPGYLTAG